MHAIATILQDPKDKLELKENVDSGVYVKDLTTFVVKSAMEIDHVMQVSEPLRSDLCLAVSFRAVSSPDEKGASEKSIGRFGFLFGARQC